MARNADGRRHQPGFRDMFADSNERAERLRADILQIKKGRGKRAFFALRQWVSDYNDMLENSTRLAVYMEAREAGISKKRAAQLAKDVTLNFNRKGTGGHTSRGHVRLL